MATEEEKIKRGQKIKADILVNGRDLSPEDEKKFQENIALIAKRAVAALGLKSIAA
jgi:hypothetical protein